MPARGAGRRNASLPHRAQMESNVIVYARRNQRLPACHHVGVGTAGSARRCATTSQTVASEQPRLRYPGDQSAFILEPSGEAYIGSGETTNVIDTINRRAAETGGLLVLVL